MRLKKSSASVKHSNSYFHFSSDLFKLLVPALVSIFFAPQLATALDDDSDGIDNGQEIIDGTDVNDPDSYMEHGGSEYCVEWNGFLSNLMQVVELRNAGCSTLGLQLQLIDGTGVVKHTSNTTVAQGGEIDVIANALPGFTANSYGLVCATITSGETDTLDTQLSVYDLTATSFNYAYSSPDLPPRTGRQTISFNNYFPSLSADQLSNFVAGFVQIINQDSTDESGDLVFYNPEGTEIRRTTVTVKAKGRSDIATHEIGANTFGTVEWQPVGAAKKFRIIQNRYYFNGANPLAPISGVVSLTAKRGSGALVSTPFSTQSRIAVVEISSSISGSTTVTPAVYDSAGALTSSQPQSIVLPAKGSRHLVLNNYVSSGVGNVQLQASQPGAIAATLIEYGIDSAGRFKFASASDPKAGNGQFQNASYNNFLGECKIRLSNLTSTSRQTAISMKRFDGASVTLTSPVTVPAHGVTEVNVCGAETQNAYGAVSLTPSASRTLTGQLVRSNRSGSEFTTPLRERSRCTPSGLSVTGSPLQMVVGGANGTLTITNNSSDNFAANIAANLVGTALDGQVTEIGNTCANVAPGGNCTLTFSPGASGVIQTTFPILGSNTTSVNADIEVIGPTTLSSSVSTLALATGGIARQITISNGGSAPAVNVVPQLSSPLPAGSILTPTTCGTIAPSATCALTVTPGSTPTAAPGVLSPSPITVTVKGTNTNAVTPTINILAFGSVYQSGYLFDIDDSTPSTESIGGKVAALIDQALPFPSGVAWSTNSSGTPVADNIAGITEASVSPCNGKADGICNTAQILATYPSINPTFYAAGLCSQTISGHSDWYLPSICELGYDRLGADSGCGTSGSPLVDNMQSNLVDNGDIGGLSGLYHSSTEFSSAPAGTIWANLFATGGSSQQGTFNKSLPLAVRCARMITSGS
jgi:hypothetical protein